MTGHFGPAVIGKEQYEKEKALVSSGKLKFGPAVTDQALLDEAREKARNGAAARPPEAHGIDRPQDQRVDRSQPSTPPEVPGVVQEFMVGIRDLKKALSGNPLLVDEFMRSELGRPDGMRKTAVELMVAAEKRRPDGRRLEVLDTLGEWLIEAG